MSVCPGNCYHSVNVNSSFLPYNYYSKNDVTEDLFIVIKHQNETNTD